MRDLLHDEALHLRVVWPLTVICHKRSLVALGPSNKGSHELDSSFRKVPSVRCRNKQMQAFDLAIANIDEALKAYE